MPGFQLSVGLLNSPIGKGELENPYFLHSKLSKFKFEKLLRLFADDVPATVAARRERLSVRTVNEIFLILRERIDEETSPWIKRYWSECDLFNMVAHRLFDWELSDWSERTSEENAEYFNHATDAVIAFVQSYFEPGFDPAERQMRLERYLNPPQLLLFGPLEFQESSLRDEFYEWAYGVIRSRPPSEAFDAIHDYIVCNYEGLTFALADLDPLIVGVRSPLRGIALEECGLELMKRHEEDLEQHKKDVVGVLWKRRLSERKVPKKHRHLHLTEVYVREIFRYGHLRSLVKKCTDETRMIYDGQGDVRAMFEPSSLKSQERADHNELFYQDLKRSLLKRPLGVAVKYVGWNVRTLSLRTSERAVVD